MKIGLIARMDNSGLGNLTWEFYNHMHPSKTMVIDLSGIRTTMRSFPERYPDGEVVIAAPSFEEVEKFLDGLDIVFSAETPYSFRILERAHLLSIKTIIQPMYEFSGWLKDNITMPNMLGIPSDWHIEDFPSPKIYLPVPIATERFIKRDTAYAKHFIHVVGNPAANDRNGTEDFINALMYVKASIRVTIYSQNPGYVQKMLLGRTLSPTVMVSVDSMQPENYWEMYRDGDVMVMPRRYGGLCMPVNEALGAGMPVIMPYISPNNSWLSKEWLTPAELKLTTIFKRGNISIDVYKTNPTLLAELIDKFATDPHFYQNQAREARALAKKFSWDELAPLYNETFNNMLKS